MFLIPEEYFEIKEVPEKGRGAFALKEINPGLVIGDYLGKLIHPKDEPQENEPLYIMWFNDQATILPDPQKPGLPIINHSCMPNCEMYRYNQHVLYFALRRILPGEELTVDYGLEPPDADCNPCTHACRCATPLCRGSWHVSAEAIAKWEQFTHLKEIANSPLPVAYGEELPPLESYPVTIDDNENYKLFGSLSTEPVEISSDTFPSLGEIRQNLRNTGRQLLLSKFNTIVYGIQDGLLISKLLT